MSDSYVSIFLDSAFAVGNPIGPLTLLILFLGRMLPIIAQAPFFGSRVLPHPVKIAFAISLFVIFLPKLLLVTKTPLTFNAFTVVILLKEILVGAILGFMISIPFTIIQTTGMIIDHQRGGASLMVNDPTIQNQSSPLGTLFNMILIVLFFLMDGPFLFIDAILDSYDVIPPDRFFNPQLFEKTSDFGVMMINLFNKAMKIAAQLATPALLTILMTDVFLGITNRLAPQVQITFLGLPLKSLLGLTTICLGWHLFTLQMSRETYSWLGEINRMIQMFTNSQVP